MKEQTKNTNNTSVLKEFTKYVSANVIAMIGLSCYILADTFSYLSRWGNRSCRTQFVKSVIQSRVFHRYDVCRRRRNEICHSQRRAKRQRSKQSLYAHGLYRCAFAIVLLCSAYLRHALWRRFSARKATLSNTATHMFRLSFALLRSLCSAMFSNFVRNDARRGLR